MRYQALALALLLALLAWAAPSAGAAPALPGITLKVGHSRIVKVPRRVERVSVGRDEIADVLVITPRQIYVNARRVGTTNITLWSKGDRLIGVFEVRVVRDLSLLKERLHQVLPGEPIEVRELEGSVVLSGRVSSPEVRKRAEELARALIPDKDMGEGKHKGHVLKQFVVNLIEVGAVHQVLLKVRFAEVSRRALKRLNINLGFADSAGNFIFTFLGGLTAPVAPREAGNLFDLAINSNKITGAGGWRVGSGRLLGFIDALKENGLAKILAEPNLVAASGQEAEFLAGGEFPIPVPQRENITITFKKFGVQLKFKPEVLPNRLIRLMVEPEVSELDFSGGVAIQGYAVPSLTTRRAKTQLELHDGQSFMIAGMFRDDITQVLSRIPLLGEIPVLGALFRSTDFQNKRTELVIVVTPQIVEPGATAPDSLPTDNVRVPDDFDLYLMGKMVEVGPGPSRSGRGKKQQEGVPRSLRELEGRFGHALAY